MPRMSRCLCDMQGTFLVLKISSTFKAWRADALQRARAVIQERKDELRKQEAEDARRSALAKQPSQRYEHVSA